MQLEQAIQDKATPAVENIKQAYEQAIQNINADMKAVVRGLSKASSITEDEARKLLNQKESRQQYRELIKLYDETTDERAKKDIALKINRQAYGARMTRLEALKQRVYIHLMSARNTEQAEHTALHRDTLQRSYYSNIHNIAKGFDVGINFAVLPKKAIDKALSAKWLGSNYSRRIWNNNQQFIEKVQSTITDGISAGHSISRMSDKLIDYVAVENKGQRYIAERLARSETAHFMAEGQLEAYKEAGIEKYQFVVAFSERTCDICGGLDGEIIPVSEARAGDNYPPIHANCRCTTVLAGFEPATRIARDAGTGKNYKLDGSMTYNEWRDSLTPEQKATLKYVDKFGGNDIMNVRGDDVAEIIKLGNINTQPLEKEFGNLRTDEIIITNERIEHIKLHHPEDYELFEKYGVDTVKNPDIIIKDCKNDGTVFMIKQLENTNLNVVSRLVLPSDSEKLKNSVMTFYRIRQKNLLKLEKKNKILYKKE